MNDVFVNSTSCSAFANRVPSLATVDGLEHRYARWLAATPARRARRHSHALRRPPLTLLDPAPITDPGRQPPAVNVEQVD